MARGNKRILLFFFFVFFLFPHSHANGSESLFKLKGWMKTTFSVHDTSSLENETTKRIDASLRMELSGKINSALSLNCAYKISPLYEKEKKFSNGMFFNTQILTYRADDINNKIHSTKNGNYTFEVNQNLDRLFFSIQTDSADIKFGRQSISFGSSRFVNPLDVLTSFSFDTIDQEERFGVDAIRIRLPFGEMGEIDFGYVFGDSFEYENSAFYLNTKFSVKDSDYTLMAMAFMENLLLGLDFQTSVLEAGFWMEAGYVIPNALNKSNSDDKNYLRISTGFDYNFLSRLYGFIEYHYNEAGSSSLDGYLENGNKTAYKQGRVFLLSRHYLIPGFSCELSPLCNLRSSIIINLQDGSSFISPNVVYSLAENFYLEAGAFISTGKSSSVDYRKHKLNVASEFGLYQNIYFLSLRFYF